MQGREHVAVALAGAAGLLYLTAGPDAMVSGAGAAAFGAAALGSLAPDIDHPSAWISNRIPGSLLGLGLGSLLLYALAAWELRQEDGGLFDAMFASLVTQAGPYLHLMWALVVLGGGLVVLSKLVRLLTGHRGATHSLAVAVGLTLLSTLWFGGAGYPMAGIWLGFGYVTHLLTDALTPKGCPALLWPWRPRASTQPSDPIIDDEPTTPLAALKS